MKYFLAKDDESRWEKYRIKALHKWSLPGVKCSVCGWTGGTTRASYPSVQLPRGVDPRPYRSCWPVPPERIRELLGPIEPLVPSGLPTGAGMEFGPLVGHCRGRLDDVSWIDCTLPLVSEIAIEKLRLAGVRGLVAVKPEISRRGRKPFEYLELDIEPRAKLDAACFEEERSTCPCCGMRWLKLVDEDWGGKPTVMSASFPQGNDLVRIAGSEGAIVVTEHFVKVVRSLDLSGIYFEEIAVR